MIIELASRDEKKRKHAKECLRRILTSAERFLLTPAILVHPITIKALVRKRADTRSFIERLEIGTSILRKISRVVSLEMLELGIEHMEKAVEIAYWDDVPYAYALDMAVAETEDLPYTLPCPREGCEEWLLNVCKSHDINCRTILC